MIKSTDVRFFTIAEYNVGTCHQFSDIAEITESCFLDLSSKEGSEIEYERFTIWQNGSNGICLTVTCQNYPDADDLETID